MMSAIKTTLTMRAKVAPITPWVLISSCLLFFIVFANAEEANSPLAKAPTAEFHFARLIYTNDQRSYRGRGRSAWATDYPEAEFHLMDGVNRMTNIDLELVDYYGGGGRTIGLMDDHLFDYPWLYAVEVGQWYLNDEEASRLREYLDRGGFLLVDDFWGPYEWQTFIGSMQRVFPDRPIIEIADNDPVLSLMFEVDKQTQIPGIRGVRPGNVPYWRGIYDDQGQLMVAINFNMDMGDAWEHAADPRYPAAMTAAAYKFAVNYIVYSMTH